jgi:hypothetical protein
MIATMCLVLGLAVALDPNTVPIVMLSTALALGVIASASGVAFLPVDASKNLVGGIDDHRSGHAATDQYGEVVRLVLLAQPRR